MHAKRLLTEFKKAIDEMPPLEFKSHKVEELEKGSADLIKEADEVGEQSCIEIVELEAKLAKLDEVSDWATMKTEDAINKDAEIKAGIEQDFKEHKWFTISQSFFFFFCGCGCGCGWAAWLRSCPVANRVAGTHLVKNDVTRSEKRFLETDAHTLLTACSVRLLKDSGECS